MSWIWISMLIRLHLDFWFLEDFLFEPQMYIQSLYLLELVSLFVGMILPLLLAIAFFIFMERQITYGLKVFVKESSIIFIISPIFTFGLAMAGWLVIVGAENSMLSDFKKAIRNLYSTSFKHNTNLAIFNSAAVVVTAGNTVEIQIQVPTQTYLQVAGIWVYEHPLLTAALVGGVVILGGLSYTYVFYPHLLGFASAAGSLGATQKAEDQPKACTKALEEALSQATKAQAELVHERGLRLAAESANAVLKTSLTERNAELLGEQGMRIAAETSKDFIQIKSPIQERCFKETLTRVLLENPPQVMVTPEGELQVGVDRTHLIQYSFMDGIQLTHNVLMNQPISTPLPPDLLDKAAGAGQQCMDLTIQILLS